MAQPISSLQLEKSLEQIAYDLVNSLNYVGVLVATVEADGSIPVRAMYVDPQIASSERITGWETQISKLLGKEVSITNSDIAKVYINDKKYQGNLSVQAFHAKAPQKSKDLLSLFVPIVPNNAATRPITRLIQNYLGIVEVIAVPFFLETPGKEGVEIVGNLFAAKSDVITESDQDILQAFGRNAANVIELSRQRQKLLEVAKQLSTEVQTHITKEDEMLQLIVEGVVQALGYVGAMVATFEKNNALPVRAFYVDPSIASMETINGWQSRLSTLLNKDVSITNPNFARVYVDDPIYGDNLSVRAYKIQNHIIDPHLGMLFTPVIPFKGVAKQIINGVQRWLGIVEVLTMPFFVNSPNSVEPQFVGNLFVATADERGFREEDIQLLQAYGSQAAAAIFNSRLYQEVVEQRNLAIARRDAGVKIGMMAFTASKSIHRFKNHVGFIRGQLQLLDYFDKLPESSRQEIIASTPKILERLDTINQLISTLGEPFREVDSKFVQINTCIEYAKKAVISDYFANDQNIQVSLELQEDVSSVWTSQDMLVEAFTILIKNSVDALQEISHLRKGQISITSLQKIDQAISVTLKDNGPGISHDNLPHIFDFGWSTKEHAGLGFGLFWVKDYLEGLGGDIKVSSIIDKGTTFTLKIPVAKAIEKKEIE